MNNHACSSLPEPQPPSLTPSGTSDSPSTVPSEGSPATPAPYPAILDLRPISGAGGLLAEVDVTVNQDITLIACKLVMNCGALDVVPPQRPYFDPVDGRRRYHTFARLSRPLRSQIITAAARHWGALMSAPLAEGGLPQ